MSRTSSARPRRRWAALPLATLAAGPALSTAVPAQARPVQFFAETSSAFWGPTHECADGSTVSGTFLVSSTRDFEAPDTEDADPTTRLQFLAVCDDGTSFSWGAVLPATITSKKKLRGVHTVGGGVARDIFGVAHQVTFDVTWKGTGPLEKTRNGPGSRTKVRTATATGRVTFDGEVFVDGPADHPTRPEPFIRVDTER